MSRSIYSLTDAGWPRPINEDGYPVPWVAPLEDLGQVNEGRRDATVSGAVCQVCGLGFGFDEMAYGFAKFSEADEERNVLPLEYGEPVWELPGVNPEDRVRLVDGAVLHLRCAKLTAARCPHIVRSSGHLVCVQVPANDATPELDDIDGALRPTYSVQDVLYAPWPVPR